MQSFSITTLGCKVNHSESMAIKASMIEAGYKNVEDDSADILIVNSCTVTHVAAAKSRQTIRKKISNNPNAIVVVVGCYSQISPEEVKAIDGVDVVVGTSGKFELPDIIESYTKNKITDFHKCASEISKYEYSSVEPSYETTRAFVKIQDGCNNFCSYCIIPHARGRIRSRSIDSIISEIDFLAGQGFKEVVLTGIHMASYGLELKDEPRVRLIDVIENVAKAFPEMRIRIGSLEPKIVTEDFVKSLREISGFCDSFHLSLQSGSDKILKSMNRRYTSNDFLNAVSIIRKYFPKAAISSDLIVGFPSESTKDFEITKKFCESIGFADLHVFPYSKRIGTPAADFPFQVSEPIKKERVHILGEVSDNTKKDYLNSFIGSEVEVLVERTNKNSAFGHSKNYIPVFIRKGDLGSIEENQLINCKVVGIYKNGVEGEYHG